MNQPLEHWQQEQTMALLYAYLHSGRSGRRFQCCAEVLRALERKHQAEWEEVRQRIVRAEFHWNLAGRLEDAAGTEW